MCSVQWSVTDARHCVQLHPEWDLPGWGVIATMNGVVYQPPWTFRPSCYARRLPIDTCLVSEKFYKSPLTNYGFGVAMGGFLLKLQHFKKVKLLFGHPVLVAWSETFKEVLISANSNRKFILICRMLLCTKLATSFNCYITSMNYKTICQYFVNFMLTWKKWNTDFTKL